MQIKNSVNGLTVFRYTFNMCNIEKGRKRGNILASTIFGIVEQSANFNISCPFKKGIRKYKQMTIPDISVLPFIKLGETWQVISNLQSKEKKMLDMWVTVTDFIMIEIDD